MPAIHLEVVPRVVNGVTTPNNLVTPRMLAKLTLEPTHELVSMLIRLTPTDTMGSI
jgi:hypothetical protein